MEKHFVPSADASDQPAELVAPKIPHAHDVEKNGYISNGSGSISPVKDDHLPLKTTSDGTVLVPQPSDDPEEPLVS